MENIFFSQYPYLCDTFFISRETSVEKAVVDAGELISPYRLDFMAKLLWIEALNGKYDSRDAERIYEAHLQAFSSHLMTEPGQPGKKGYDSYCDMFRRICTAVDKTPGDLIELKAPIPVDKKGMAMDGAHRISAAIYYRKRVSVYLVEKEIPNRYDYRFFQKRYMEEEYVIKMVEKYVTLRPCRLYMQKGRQNRKTTRRKIFRECAPVYMKRMLSGEVWIILDGIWINKNGKEARVQQLLGEDYLEGTEEIVNRIREWESQLLFQRRGYAYKKRLGIFFGRCWSCIKVKIKRLSGRPV